MAPANGRRVGGQAIHCYSSTRSLAALEDRLFVVSEGGCSGLQQSLAVSEDRLSMDTAIARSLATSEDRLFSARAIARSLAMSEDGLFVVSEGRLSRAVVVASRPIARCVRRQVVQGCSSRSIARCVGKQVVQGCRSRSSYRKTGCSRP